MAFTSSLPSASPLSKKKMSITETYYLAHTARSKLSKAAASADHDLRLLVGHANLLDSLMLDLANAEKEQEQWFNNTVRNATKKVQPSHIRWADTIEEESMEDYSDDDDSYVSDEDYSDYEEDEEVFEDLTLQATAPAEHEHEDDVEEVEVEQEEDVARLALTRTPSRPQPLPELLEDLSSDDEDMMPPSPEHVAIDTFTADNHPAKQADLLSEVQTQPIFEEHGFAHHHHHHQGTMITAF